MSEKKKDKIQTKRADRMAGRGPHKMFKMEMKKYTDPKKGERTMNVCDYPDCKHYRNDRCDRPECSRRNDIYDCYEPKKAEKT